MKKRPDENFDELEIFYASMQNVKPLKNDKTVLRKKKKLGAKTVQKKTAHNIHIDNFTNLNDTYAESVFAETIIQYKSHDLSHKILRNLNKGQYNVEATLDLHGMTVEEAKKELITFLNRCLKEHIQTVLIIHGKGRNQEKPILKNLLNQWLRQLDFVLAFSSAKQHHGGKGALYLLLKRTNLEDRFE